MTALDALRAERRLLETAIDEATVEVERHQAEYRELRNMSADIQTLIPARMLWSLAQIHLVNVRSEWFGVRDRLSCAMAAPELAEGTVGV